MREAQLDLKRSVARGDLSQMEMLLEEYFREKGHYPPAKYQRAPGEPFHSWRVLLLSLMGDEWERRFEKYDFSKEWNSPENLNVTEGEVPAYYQYGEKKDHFTDYVLIKMGDKSESRTFPTSCVRIIGNAEIVLIEDGNSTIHWMSPEG